MTTQIEKKLIGTIVDSFTVGDRYRLLIVKDASKELEFFEGDTVEVEFLSGKVLKVQVQDAFCEEASHFNFKNVDSKYIVSIKIPIIADFTTDIKSVVGSKVFLIINP